jgi:hypothetical protein
MLLKPHTTARGTQLNCYRLMPGRVDPLTSEASFIVSGYANASIPKNTPTIEVFAKLRLSADKFNLYLSKTALRAGAVAGKDMYRLLYDALKAEPTCVVCDAGGDFFADAEDDEAVATEGEEVAATDPVPLFVTQRQIRQGLIRIGMYDAVMAAMEQAPAKDRVDWEYAKIIRRDWGLINVLGSMLGKTPEEIDNLFRLSAGIDD